MQKTSEFTTLVAACMEQLEWRHRKVLELRTNLNCSYDEIAQRLGLNVAAQ